MCRTIVEEYIRFLNDCITEYKGSHQLKVQRLRDELLKQNFSLNDFEILLSASITPPKVGFIGRFFGYQSNIPNECFTRRTASLLNTIARLKEIQAEKEAILRYINEIKSIGPAQPLIELLKEILHDSNYFFYEKMLSVTAILRDEREFQVSLQSIIDYLDQLPDLVCLERIKPRSGSFDADEAINTQHRQCLALLKRSSKVHNSANDVSINSNNLLQSVLDVYRSKHELLKQQAVTEEGARDPVCGASAF